MHTEIHSTMTDQESYLRVAASGTSPDISSYWLTITVSFVLVVPVS
jgi:hypothetical protein